MPEPDHAPRRVDPLEHPPARLLYRDAYIHVRVVFRHEPRRHGPEERPHVVGVRNLCGPEPLPRQEELAVRLAERVLKIKHPLALSGLIL